MKTSPFFFLWAILLVSLCQPLFAQQDSSWVLQTGLEKLLQNIQTVGKESNPSDLTRYPRSDFQVPAIKARFLELLTPTLNEQEKQAIINKQIEFSKTGNEHVAKKIIKKDTTKEFAQVYDSLMKDIIELGLNRYIQSHRVNEGIIHAAGWLDLQYTIPYLENILNDPKQKLEKETTLLALARLQKEPYYSDMIEKYSNIETIEEIYSTGLFDSVFKLAYIGTQESIFAATKLLNVKGFYNPFSDDDSKVMLVWQVIEGLLMVIEDQSFLDYFSNNDIDMFNITQNDVDFAKKWMEEHKGNIKFNRDG